MSKIDKLYIITSHLMLLATGLFVGTLSYREVKLIDSVVIIMMICNSYLIGYNMAKRYHR